MIAAIRLGPIVDALAFAVLAAVADSPDGTVTIIVNADEFGVKEVA